MSSWPPARWRLGIDVGDLDRVVQIGAPKTVASFLQRSGRTRRRPETTRNVLFLATDGNELLLRAPSCASGSRVSLSPSRLPRDRSTSSPNSFSRTRYTGVLLLGGKGWSVRHVDRDRHEVFVEPAEQHGGSPYGPAALGSLLANIQAAGTQNMAPVSLAQDAVRDLKFAFCLPPRDAVEVLSLRLSDPEGALGVMSRPVSVVTFQ